jgi:FtsP/CotA-like multicopper oxidase with cupredoxin domain
LTQISVTTGTLKRLHARRAFLAGAGATALALGMEAIPPAVAETAPDSSQRPEGKADYTIRIATSLIELAPDRIISTTTYNGQFPGPLIRFKEGRARRGRYPQRH